MSMLLCIVVGLTSLSPNVLPITGLLNVTADKESSSNNSYLEDEIKHSLRKNNDDYESDQYFASKPTPKSDSGRRSINRPYATPTSYGVLSEPLASETVTLTVNDYITVLRGFNNKEKYNQNGRKLAQRSKDKHVMRIERGKVTRAVGEFKDGHAEKWKLLVDKNKRLFLYTSTPKIAPSNAAVAMSVGSSHPHAHAHSKRVRQVVGDQTTRTVPAVDAFAKGMRQALNAFRPVRTPGANRRPPNADQLDMAPARGAYIHDLRLKGRFCHRHVLWPEGPKYDSKGNTIMPPFDVNKFSKGFAETTKPLFVLPRCCNCCKKSVLGCQ